MLSEPKRVTASLTARVSGVREWIVPAVVLVAALIGVHGAIHIVDASGHHLRIPIQSILVVLWVVTILVVVGGFAAMGSAYTSLAEYLESEPGVNLEILPADERGILEPILETPGITQVEVVARSDFSDAKISQTLESLRERGLVYREPQGRTYRLYPGSVLAKPSDEN